MGITRERSTTAARGAGGARELGRLFTGGTCARRLLAAAFVILLQAGRAATTRKTRKCVCARGKTSEEEEEGAIRGRGVVRGLPRALSRSLYLSPRVAPFPHFVLLLTSAVLSLRFTLQRGYMFGFFLLSAWRRAAA